MKTILNILKWIFAIIGFIATYLPLMADYWRFNMWGLAWQIWAMIGFTIFWIAIAIVIWQLHSANKRMMSEDAKLERHKKELEIEKLEADKIKRNSKPI
jgi:protein-S-isoprenylcysteine O-methyltransferase Ste14